MVFRVVVDVETSGKRSYNAAILEAAAVVLDDELKEAASFQTLANPGEELLRLASPEAMAVNRLSREEILAAPPAAAAAEQFREFLKRWPRATIHAFNNDFDLWFLARDPWLVPSRGWGECVMRAAMEIMADEDALDCFPNGNPKFPNLDSAAKFFGIPTRNRHRALDDARTAAAVYAGVLNHRAVDDEARVIMDDGF